MDNIRIEQGVSHKIVELTRASFGEGRPGEMAWRLISGGATCEALIKGEPCGKRAIGTTDFDVLGDMDQKPHCSPEHDMLMRKGIAADLHKQGRNTVFGINGFGRS
jgi:hypothetical protein